MARPSRTTQRDRKVQPPRPPNAWILYRSHQFKQIRLTNERLSQASVSKIISDMWRNESEEVKRHFEQEAETKKAQHQALYPDYRFCPKRKEPKQSQKKSKCRDATPSEDANDNEDGGDDASPPVPAPPPMPFVYQPPTQPCFVPSYHHNMVMPQPFMIPRLAAGHYGPGGPSPPMSAAPSPAPHASSESPPHPRSASSSSSSSTRPSPSADSHASSSSSPLSANPMYLPSLPNSHHPSPNPYATVPLSTHLFQNAIPGQLPLASPRLQLRSAENTVDPAAPVWNNISAYLPGYNSQNSEEVVNLDLAIPTEHLAEFQQAFSPGPSYDSLHGVISRTDEAGVFNLSNIESSALLNYPHGALEVAMGPEASTVNYNEDIFANFDLDEFQRTIDALTQGCPSSAPLASRSVHEDLQSLFQTPPDPELEAYTAAQQRQPSAFTQDMMNFLNFEAAEEATQNASGVVSPAPLSTTAAPQQVHVQNVQASSETPVFAQMTNTPAVVSGTSYVPPAGAMYSSTRRVAASWKPSFVLPHSQMDETISSWSL